MINLGKNSEEKTCFKCLFKNEFAITMLSVGVQSANIKKRKTAFRVVFFGYSEFFSWKTYFEWFGKIYHWETQEWWEYLKTTFQKKIPMEGSFHEKNFWRTLFSVGVQKPEDRKKKVFRTFSWTDSHFQDENFFEKFGINYQIGTQERWK